MGKKQQISQLLKKTVSAWADDNAPRLGASLAFHTLQVEATIVSGEGLFPLNGVPQDSNPSRLTVWLHEERSSVLPSGAPDQRTIFTPERIAVEKVDGTPVAERIAPK